VRNREELFIGGLRMEESGENCLGEKVDMYWDYWAGCWA
jgi:hypothetical protein